MPSDFSGGIFAISSVSCGMFLETVAQTALMDMEHQAQNPLTTLQSSSAFGAGTAVDRHKTRRERWRTFSVCLLLFFLFSFLGWCLEKTTFYFFYGVNADRGFLRLPFCTIYGTSLFAIRMLFNLPLNRNFPYPLNLFALILYAALAAAVATGAELLIGTVFDRVFGLCLWSYRAYPFAYGKYICLSMSIAWGVMITAAMLMLWAPLERLLKKIPLPAVAFCNMILTAALATDFIITAVSCLS